MKAKHHQKDDQRKVEYNQSNDNTRKAIERSFFEWSDGMRVIRQGKGEVAMTEGELAKFFGVSWQKINHKVRLIKQTMCLKPYEVEAGNATSSISKRGDSVESYAPLCPLPIIIALSFHLNSVEAGMFRKYLCQRLQSSTPTFISVIVDTSGVQGTGVLSGSYIYY
ncbi:hypothetical protein HMPREF9018_1761 [Prevotella amnii CRIS 21A-A]|uniref:Uncharacterized protein n=1 Tax=Prevotella amnii CRIS 21A-A TaxID=679191 RepID=E1GVY3_9BACT|nr:hypothetical protein [Prevotella amnii]EFN91161.1 hypothetical protein HMPREF9018_1761 [Prevotella amnii CRIS 21A-A]